MRLRERPKSGEPSDTDRNVSVLPGRALPLGCSLAGLGVNFPVCSRHAERVDLLLFDDVERPESSPLTIVLDASCHRTGDVWHVRLDGLPPGCRYAWRAHGLYAPSEGYRFNPRKVLLDPYAIALVGTDCWDFSCACGHDPDSDNPLSSISMRDNVAVTPRCLVVEPEEFDWQDDRPSPVTHGSTRLSTKRTFAG